MREITRGTLRQLIGSGDARSSPSRLSDMLADSGWLLAATLVGGLFTVLQNVLVARAFGVDEFATFVLVVGAVTVLNQLTSFRMNEFVVRYVSAGLALERSSDAAAALKLALLVEAAASAAAFLLVFAAAPLAAGPLLGAPERADLLRIYAGVILANIVAETTVGGMHAFGLFRPQAALTVLSRGLPVVGTMAALGAGAGLRGVLAAMVAGVAGGAALQLAALLWHARRRLGAAWWRASVSAVSGGWRRAARFAVSTNVGSTLSLVTKDADIVWIGLLRPPAEAAFYRVAFQIVSVALIPVAPLAQRLYAEMSRAVAAERWTGLRQLLGAATIVTTAYVVPVAVVVAAAGWWIVRALFGDEFGPATPALVALLPGMAVANVLVWTRPALLALHEAGFTVRVNVALAVVKIAGLLTIVPLWGFVANAALVSALYAAGVGICAARVLALLRHPRVVAAESPLA